MKITTFENLKKSLLMHFRTFLFSFFLLNSSTNSGVTAQRSLKITDPTIFAQEQSQNLKDNLNLNILQQEKINTYNTTYANQLVKFKAVENDEFKVFKESERLNKIRIDKIRLELSEAQTEIYAKDKLNFGIKFIDEYDKFLKFDDAQKKEILEIYRVKLDSINQIKATATNMAELDLGYKKANSKQREDLYNILNNTQYNDYIAHREMKKLNMSLKLTKEQMFTIKKAIKTFNINRKSVKESSDNPDLQNEKLDSLHNQKVRSIRDILKPNQLGLYKTKLRLTDDEKKTRREIRKLNDVLNFDEKQLIEIEELLRKLKYNEQTKSLKESANNLDLLNEQLDSLHNLKVNSIREILKPSQLSLYKTKLRLDDDEKKIQREIKKLNDLLDFDVNQLIKVEEIISQFQNKKKLALENAKNIELVKQSLKSIEMEKQKAIKTILSEQQLSKFKFAKNAN